MSDVQISFSIASMQEENLNAHGKDFYWKNWNRGQKNKKAWLKPRAIEKDGIVVPSEGHR